MGKLIITKVKIDLSYLSKLQEHNKKQTLPIHDKIHQKYCQSRFWHKDHKKRPCQPDIKMKNILWVHIYQLWTRWTKHSVFCHVQYSITEPVISSQGQHVILFPTTKRQWQIHWPLSPELNTFITTKTTLHLLPSRPLWAPTITHTRRLHHIPLLKTSQSALSIKTQTVAWSLWVYWL